MRAGTTALSRFAGSELRCSVVTEPDFLLATRTSYDALATDYAARFNDPVPIVWDRAVLAAFAEYVLNAGGGAVADVGCGPGRMTAHLHGLGLEVSGIDLSPEMVAIARREHPGLRFEEGSMLALDLPDGSLGGLVAWYSTIHVPLDLLPDVFAEFRRVLVPGGHLLLAFQVGDEPLRLTEPFGHAVSLDFHRRSPEHVAGLLAEAGLDVRARLVREIEKDEGVSQVPQAYLLARRPPSGS
jgi:SAM-dependent methyltransferase